MNKPTGKEIVEGAFPYISESIPESRLKVLYKAIDSAIEQWTIFLSESPVTGGEVYSRKQVEIAIEKAREGEYSNVDTRAFLHTYSSSEIIKELAPSITAVGGMELAKAAFFAAREIKDYDKVTENTLAKDLKPRYSWNEYLSTLPKGDAEEGKEEKKCPHCGSREVVMFTADDDTCQSCHKYFPAI